MRWDEAEGRGEGMRCRDCRCFFTWRLLSCLSSFLERRFGGGWMLELLRGGCGLPFWRTRSSCLRFQPCLRFRPSHQDVPSPSISRRASLVLFSASGSIALSGSCVRLPFSETLFALCKHVVGGNGADICACVLVVCVWGGRGKWK